MAEARRQPDRINAAPRFTQADADRLNARFADASAAELLSSVLREELAGRIAVLSSFGAESVMLLHLIATIDPTTPVIFLDTGKHFAETIAYRDRIVAQMGLTGLKVIAPDRFDLAKRDAGGERWRYDPDGCCDLRKVRPLASALTDFDATITGRKGFQALTRVSLPRFEVDKADAAGRLKINPLADWSKTGVEAYLSAQALPQHPLVARGFASIGCAPCTDVVTPGEAARAGRWRGTDKVECGIHVPLPGAAAPARAPGHMPA